MFKFAAIVSLMLVATWSQADSRRHKKDASENRDSGSTMWASSLSCDSCGSECTSACGTRQFRSCCFNYLRKKRTSDVVENVDTRTLQEISRSAQKPLFIVQDIPVEWTPDAMRSGYRPFDNDNFENRLFNV